jgi:hypothetical protein
MSASISLAVQNMVHRPARLQHRRLPYAAKPDFPKKPEEWARCAEWPFEDGSRFVKRRRSQKNHRKARTAPRQDVPDSHGAVLELNATTCRFWRGGQILMRFQPFALGKRHGAAKVEPARPGKVDVLDARFGKAQPG